MHLTAILSSAFLALLTTSATPIESRQPRCVKLPTLQIPFNPDSQCSLANETPSFEAYNRAYGNGTPRNIFLSYAPTLPGSECTLNIRLPSGSVDIAQGQLTLNVYSLAGEPAANTCGSRPARVSLVGTVTAAVDGSAHYVNSFQCQSELNYEVEFVTWNSAPAALYFKSGGSTVQDVVGMYLTQNGC
ncbi:MAG: hypothetical protein M1829_003982 [Trizodia sp. TS-e1964]|nr:MAG: hypothetical protein M1829_003982 [Trizodia sp. TS-e1964]